MKESNSKKILTRLFCLALIGCCIVQQLLLFCTKNSNANHGYWRNDVAESIRHEDAEYSAGYLGPIKLYEYTSNSSTSVVRALTGSLNKLYQRCQHQIVEIHNHPHPPISDSSFSPGDISNLNAVSSTIIVDDYHTQTLRARDDWPTEDEVNAYLAEKYNLHFNDEGVIIHSDPILLDMQDAGLVFLTSDNTYITRIALIEELAEHFNLEFTVEPYVP